MEESNKDVQANYFCGLNTEHGRGKGGDVFQCL